MAIAPLLAEPGQWECPHDFFVSAAKDLADERGEELCDADFHGMIVQAVVGKAADSDVRVLSSIEQYSLRLRWLTWAPADQPRERRRDVAAEIVRQRCHSRCQA